MPLCLFSMYAFTQEIIILRYDRSIAMFFFFPENRTVYGIRWKYMVELDRPQMTIKYGSNVFHAR